MCLSIPSKVIKIDKETDIATVDTMGVRRETSLTLIDEEVNIGDYVLIHIGFAMNKINEEAALDSLKIYEEIVQKMNEEDQKNLIDESDNCPNGQTS